MTGAYWASLNKPDKVKGRSTIDRENRVSKSKSSVFELFRQRTNRHSMCTI